MLKYEGGDVDTRCVVIKNCMVLEKSMEIESMPHMGAGQGKIERPALRLSMSCQQQGGVVNLSTVCC